MSGIGSVSVVRGPYRRLVGQLQRPGLVRLLVVSFGQSVGLGLRFQCGLRLQ
jgi:hypothetical protein